MPELKLGLNDKILMDAHGRANKGKAVDLEDIRFHQCVRLSRFENDRTISLHTSLMASSTSWCTASTPPCARSSG